MRLVFDIGATTTRLGLSRDGWSLWREISLPTDTSANGPQAFVQAARRLVGRQAVTVAAGGVAGLIDRPKGLLVRSPNLPDWGRVDMEALLGAVTPRLYLENDTALVGLGEAWAGSGTTKGIMAYVTVSTGVNGARIVGGGIDPTTEGFEIGQQIIEADGREETLENLIGGRQLQERFGRLPSTIDSPELWRREIHYLAVGLHNATTHWSPEIIVLGGGMMRDISLDYLQREMKALPQAYRRLPELRPAALGGVGGLYGGLALIRQQLAS